MLLTSCETSLRTPFVQLKPVSQLARKLVGEHVPHPAVRSYRLAQVQPGQRGPMDGDGESYQVGLRRGAKSSTA